MLVNKAERPYIGRFAPSPSGPLHMGSLVAALGSYLQAKSQHGQWLVRIEDIDPPREQIGSDLIILDTLQAHGLNWNGPVRYQSQQSDFYNHNLKQLITHQLAYYCQCTRKQIKQAGGFYLGTCRTKRKNTDNSALRIKNDDAISQFVDELHGLVSINNALANEDFIIHRRDGLYAYNLAVVLDDRQQNITQIVRGSDLIEPTVRQLSLWQCFNTINKPVLPLPTYMHLPLVKDKNGNKLSKQNHAPAICNDQASKNLVIALELLQQSPPKELEKSAITHIIDWAIEHWQPPVNKQN